MRPSTLSAAQQEFNCFCKGIKCDPDTFLTLLKEAHFDKWIRLMIAQMQAQRVGNICTTIYIELIDPDKRTLDCEKQTYMYSVLTKWSRQVMGCIWLQNLLVTILVPPKFGKHYYVVLCS